MLNMTKLPTDLEDLWVMKEVGIVIFSKSNYRKSIKQDLLGSLLSATYHLSEGMLGRFSIKKHQFLLIEKNKILFVFQYRLKTDRRAILQVSEFLISEFFELFPKSYIDEFGYNEEKFENFKEYVKTKREILGAFIDKLYNHASLYRELL